MPPQAGFPLLVLVTLAAAAVVSSLGGGGPRAPFPAPDGPLAVVAAGADAGRAVCAGDLVAVGAALAQAAASAGCRPPAVWIGPAAGERLRVTPGANGGCAVERGDMGGAARLALGLPLPVDRASLADLRRLPGVGPRLAEAIVAARALGGFRDVTDLLRVRGFGPGRLRALRGLVSVEGRGPPSPSRPTAAPAAP